MSLWIWILHQLYRYKFLCVSQMEILWIGVSKKTIYKSLWSLRERNLIWSTKYKYNPERWKLEDIHFLKPTWKDLVIRHFGYSEDDIKIQQQHKWFYDDYAHRKQTIACMIALDQHCDNLSIERFSYYQYFETDKRPDKQYRQKATKIEVSDGHIIPDTVIVAKCQKVQLLLCLELHKGYRVKKIVQQLKRYAYVLASGAASEVFKVDSNPYILTVFEKESTMRTTLERMKKDTFYSYIKQYYLFKTYDDFVKDPLQHWINLKGDIVSLLNLW